MKRALKRDLLYRALTDIERYWNLTPKFGPPNLRFPESEIELMAHEFAHVVDLDLAPTDERGSMLIDACLSSMEPKRSDEHEYRALAIEILGLHRLEYRISIRMLATYAKDSLIFPRNTTRVEKTILQYTEKKDVQDLTDVFVSEIMIRYLAVLKEDIP